MKCLWFRGLMLLLAAASSVATLADEYGSQDFTRQQSSYLERLGDSVRASMGLSNMYLYRGIDAGGPGEPQVFADLSVEPGLGLYASVWVSNSADGAEWDLITGWRKAFGNTQWNVGVINYAYPSTAANDDLGAEAEAYAGFHWGGFQLYYYQNIRSRYGQNEDYFYVVTAFTYKRVSASLGYAEDDTLYGTGVPGVSSEVGGYSYYHFDLSFELRPNLTVTLSQKFKRSADFGGADIDPSDFAALAGGGTFNGYQFAGDDRYRPIADNDLVFVLTYSVPIEFQ